MGVVLWLVGEPGLGKTTLARALLEPGSGLHIKPKWTVGESVVAAGHYEGKPFDGADTVPYNGAKEALVFWRQWLSWASLTLLDGDRFSNAAAVEFFRACGSTQLWCSMLQPTWEHAGLAARRRAQRGSEQNATWVKGRVTKAFNFYQSFPSHERFTLHVTPAQTAAEQAQLVRHLLVRKETV